MPKKQSKAVKPKSDNTTTADDAAKAVTLPQLPRKSAQQRKARNEVDTELTNLQTRLRELRRRHGLSQGQLSEICNLDSGALSRIETGSYEPTWRTLQSIATGLGIPIYALFTDQAEGAFARAGLELQLRNYIEIQRKSLEAAEALLAEITSSNSASESSKLEEPTFGRNVDLTED